ncbi:MAG: hypothetical protein J6581_03130 [Apibacter sp.]|jgi:hypothetical protein|nr:hypothetical protein [Apibacter sp.]
MGRLIEFIFFAIVTYFVFNYLNKIFTGTHAKKKYSKPKPHQFNNPEENSSIKKGIKWDAETVDYEEVETKDNEKK